MCADFKSIEKKITADGWVLVRISGSHYQYKKEGVSANAVIPFHRGRSVSIGVIKSLERVTGLSLQ